MKTPCFATDYGFTGSRRGWVGGSQVRFTPFPRWPHLNEWSTVWPSGRPRESACSPPLDVGCGVVRSGDRRAPSPRIAPRALCSHSTPPATPSTSPVLWFCCFKNVISTVSCSVWPFKTGLKRKKPFLTQFYNFLLEEVEAQSDDYPVSHSLEAGRRACPTCPCAGPVASPRPHGLIAPAWTRTVLSLVCASLRFSQNLERNGRSTLWGSSVYFLLCN